PARPVLVSGSFRAGRWLGRLDGRSRPASVARPDLAGGAFHRHASGWRVAALVLAEVDGPMRQGELDSQLVEALLHAAIELAADEPLLDRQGLDPAPDDDRPFGELVDAQHLERRQD